MTIEFQPAHPFSEGPQNNRHEVALPAPVVSGFESLALPLFYSVFRDTAGSMFSVLGDMVLGIGLGSDAYRNLSGALGDGLLGVGRHYCALADEAQRILDGKSATLSELAGIFTRAFRLIDDSAALRAEIADQQLIDMSEAALRVNADNEEDAESSALHAEWYEHRLEHFALARGVWFGVAPLELDRVNGSLHDLCDLFRAPDVQLEGAYTWEIPREFGAIAFALRALRLQFRELGRELHDSLQADLFQRGEIFSSARSDEEQRRIAAFLDGLGSRQPIRITVTQPGRLEISVQMSSSFEEYLLPRLGSLAEFCKAAGEFLADAPVTVEGPLLRERPDQQIECSIRLIFDQVSGLAPHPVSFDGSTQHEAHSDPLRSKISFSRVVTDARGAPHPIEFSVLSAAFATDEALDKLVQVLDACEPILKRLPKCSNVQISPVAADDLEMQDLFDQGRLYASFISPLDATARQVVNKGETETAQLQKLLAYIKVQHAEKFGWAERLPILSYLGRQAQFAELGISQKSLSSPESLAALERFLVHAVPLHLHEVPEPDESDQVDCWALDEITRVAAEVRETLRLDEKVGVAAQRLRAPFPGFPPPEDTLGLKIYQMTDAEDAPPVLLAVGRLPRDSQRISYTLLDGSLIERVRHRVSNVIDQFTGPHAVVPRLSTLDRVLTDQGILLSDSILVAVRQMLQRDAANNPQFRSLGLSLIFSKFSQDPKIVTFENDSLQVLVLKHELNALPASIRSTIAASDGSRASRDVEGDVGPDAFKPPTP